MKSATSWELPDLSTPAIPSHSQNNERAVSNTTEVVEKAIGHDNQKALIIEIDKSRQEIPTLGLNSSSNARPGL